MLPVYLDAARRRLRWRWGARTAALMLGGLLAVTLGGAALVMELVPSDTLLSAVRAGLYALPVAAALLSVALWRRRDRAVAELERRVPAFAGRLDTWHDGRRRNDATDLFVLLERQTAELAAAHPVDRAVPAREILVPALLALLLSVCLALLLAGSRPLQLAGQRLWTGELFAAAQPRILVSPGDVVVRRGSDVVINATVRGFRADAMTVHADFGGGWERAPMVELGADRYGFVLVGIGEGVDYYVADRGLSSGRFRIEVADLPEVLALETRYRFPEWTGLAERAGGPGDVMALPGTEVEVTAVADRALGETLLVVNDVARPMSVGSGTVEASRSARGAFAVSAPGRWHIAVRHEGELARISDSYLIELAEDSPPELAFVWPGHDRKATAIEEVALEFEARDDYGVTALTLRYAVNGGAWNELALGEGGHLLALENLRAGDGNGDGDGVGARALAPGDVISLYAEASDHTQSTRSALYFIDVRPFELRYRESQQMAGQGGAEGGGFDIAERQRDLLTATWNLINKQRGGAADPTAAERRALADEAEVLAALQRTLAEQVETLVARSAARGLGRDGETSEFVAELKRALEHMTPAAARLAERELEEAVPAEQRALTHLATAEASVRDVDVSLSRNDGRGTSSRSLSELMELEMDPERNRYEMPQQAALAEDAGQDADARWQRLEELAARQEQLARQSADAADSLPSRWEQARLRRELERLREALEAGRADRRSTDSAAPGESLERAIADVDRARRALDAPDGAEGRDQAAEALRRAADALRDSSRGELQARIAEAARRAGNLQADQGRVMEALEQLQEASLERAREGASLVRGDYAMQTFAEVKRRMQGDLAELRAELIDLSDAAGERSAQGARTLDRALDELDEVRVDERLAASASAFDLGQPLYVIGSESLVEDALERLGGRIAQAQRAFADDLAGVGTDPLAEVRELRRRVLEAGDDDGGFRRRALEAVAADLARMGGAGDAAGGGATMGAGLDRGLYTIRGTADENTEALRQLVLDRLDLLESALLSLDRAPVRAQQPRPSGRDSPAAARYFRTLSRGAQGDAGPNAENP